MKNSRGKKKAAGLTRYELAQALHCGLTTLDKLIAMDGLRPCGRRGPAKLYRLADARRLLVKLAPAEATAAEVLRDDYSAVAEDLRDRARALASEWVADTDWTPQWAKCVEWYATQTKGWPAAIAGKLAPLTASAAARADMFEPEPPPAWRTMPAAELLRESWPWLSCARPQLEEISRSGGLVRVHPRGAGWAPVGLWLDDPAPVHRPFQLVDPLLHGLADAMRSASPWVALVAALVSPGHADAPAATPTDVDAARASWRTARAGYRRLRVAVRRGHRRRVDVDRAICRSIFETRLAWQRLRDKAPSLAGDHLRAETAAASVRSDTIKLLTQLNGLLPEPSQPKVVASAKPKKTASPVRQGWAAGIRPDAKQRTKSKKTRAPRDSGRTR